MRWFWTVEGHSEPSHGGGLSTTGTRPSPFDHIGLRVRCGDVGGGRINSPFDGGFLAGASTFPRSDYPRSGRGSSVEWPHRARSGIDWQIYSVGFTTSTERFRYVHQ